MTTIGSQYWPVTNSGRFLCFLISMYSLGVFGYITAILASFLVDTTSPESPKQKSETEELLEEVKALRLELTQSRPSVV